MKSFKEDLMEAVSLVSNIEHQLKINVLNGNEKTILYSILLKEKEGFDFQSTNSFRSIRNSRMYYFRCY